jgi:hypothetical protein
MLGEKFARALLAAAAAEWGRGPCAPEPAALLEVRHPVRERKRESEDPDKEKRTRLRTPRRKNGNDIARKAGKEWECEVKGRDVYS